MSYDDKVLRRINQELSESEAVAFIAIKLSESSIEIGKLKSELSEKSHKIKEQNTEIENLRMQVYMLKSTFKITYNK